MYMWCVCARVRVCGMGGFLEKHATSHDTYTLAVVGDEAGIWKADVSIQHSFECPISRDGLSKNTAVVLEKVFV